MPKTERALVAALLRQFKKDGVKPPTYLVKEYERLTKRQ